MLEKEVDKRTMQIRKDKELIEQQASELRQLDQMKSRFFANISHDFRTPLTLITGPAEVMKNDEALPVKPSFRQSLQSILQNGKKLLNLVDEMLDLAKLESNEVKLHEETVDLFHFCNSVYLSFQAAAERKHMDYELDYQLEKGYGIVTDPRRLERILNNLLSNAFKFTETRGKVSMAVFLKDDKVNFEIKDTGRGIPPEDIPHVFDRFFQSKQTAWVSSTGNGIGLSLSKELADLLGGSIQVVSILGEGSTFYFSLPAKGSTKGSIGKEQETTFQIPEFIPEILPGTNEKKPRIMVVEDNPEVQSFLQLILQSDYEVHCFDDGQYALDFLQEHSSKNLPTDLILSDINMPRLNGYELIEAVKQHTLWQQLPLIMLTARLQEGSKLKALRMGVDDYLTKPFSPVELKLRLLNIYTNYQNRLASQRKYLEVNLKFESTASADQVWLQELEEHRPRCPRKRY